MFNLGKCYIGVWFVVNNGVKIISYIAFNQNISDNFDMIALKVSGTVDTNIFILGLQKAFDISLKIISIIEGLYRGPLYMNIEGRVWQLM